MRRLAPTLLLLLFISICNPTFSKGDTLTDKELLVIFKAIEKSDQSNLRYPAVRALSFLNNFNTIIGITKSQGVPKLKKEYKRRSIRNLIKISTQSTFTHILQTRPDLFLNQPIIDLLDQEVKAGRLDKSDLHTPLHVFWYDKEVGRSVPWNEEIIKYYQIAVQTFDLSLIKRW